MRNSNFQALRNLFIRCLNITNIKDSNLHMLCILNSIEIILLHISNSIFYKYNFKQVKFLIYDTFKLKVVRNKMDFSCGFLRFQEKNDQVINAYIDDFHPCKTINHQFKVYFLTFFFFYNFFNGLFEFINSTEQHIYTKKQCLKEDFETNENCAWIWSFQTWKKEIKEDNNLHIYIYIYMAKLLSRVAN